jgi:mannosyltransferase
MDGGSPPFRADNVGLAAIAVLATSGLLPWLGKPLFRDEGTSLYSAHLDWGALWRQSRVVDLVLLPYYSFLHLWIELSGSIEWVRVPSLLAFGVTVFLVG